MKALNALALLAAGMIGLATSADAQSADFMRNQCSSAGQTYFRDFTAATDMKYNGQRVDGTHAVNGRIYLETRYEDFACSYDRSGRKMIQFFAQGRWMASPLPGGNPAPDGAKPIVRVIGVASNDVLNVRSGPGTNYRKVGALFNNDEVRRLRCQASGKATWCEIEMLTDMRERGWVNARYLSQPGGSATHLPDKPPVGAGQTTTVTVRFPSGKNGTAMVETLPPGATRRYVLSARAGQVFNFQMMTTAPKLSWRILNPDGTLLDKNSATRDYRGQLWQDGKHVVEVINGSNKKQDYTVIFRIY